MRHVVLFIVLLYSSEILAQKDYGLIDHDINQGRVIDVLYTDSVIYYSSQGNSPMMSNFCAIDTNGIIDRKVIYSNLSSSSKIINVDPDTLISVYYHLVDYDIGLAGLAILIQTSNMDSVFYFDFEDPIFNWSELYYFQDFEFLDSMIIGSQSNRLMFLNLFSEELSTYDFNESSNFNFVRNKKEVFMYNDTSIYKIYTDKTVELIHETEDDLFLIQSNNSDTLFLVFDQHIEAIDLSNLSSTQLFDYDLPNKVSVQLINDHFVVKSRDDFDFDFYTLDFQGNENLIYEGVYTSNDARIINGDLYTVESPGYPVFKKTSLNQSSETAECRDVDLEYASIVHIEKEIWWTSTDPTTGEPIVQAENKYVYDLVIENLTQDTIYTLDIYSNVFFPFAFGPSQFLRINVKNLLPFEQRIITGQFSSYYYDVVLDKLTFSIPGADHFLDCNPENNSFEVVDIPSSEINISSEPLNMFPNPSSDFLFFSQVFEKEIPYKIFSQNGKTISKGKARNSIDVNHIPKGLYYIEIGKAVFKFIKN